MRVLSALAVCLISACMPHSAPQVTRGLASEESAVGPAALPLMGQTGHVPRVIQSNAQLLQTFLDLAFKMESGRDLHAFSRFEGPITVRLIGNVPPSARVELARLIGRFRTEAGINISEVPPDQPASINIDFQPRADMGRLVPLASCFVVPRLASFDEYRANRNGPAVDWTTVTQRSRVAVFVPADGTAQEVRDCLHEEVAQAMGPLNDLYHLPNSVFNDDNFHSVLTGFDMMILRLHYAPELHSGMTKAAVAERIPALLARINPMGEGLPAEQTQIAPRAWVAAVEQSFGVGGTPGNRIEAAGQMVKIARAMGWRDNRLGFSYYALGRALSLSNPAGAVTAFADAARIYRTIPGAEIQSAHVDMQLAAIALSTGKASQSIQFANRAIPLAQRAENASLLATLMLIKAEALESLGQETAAAALRLDSAGWARYGFGSEGQIRARQSEIADLSARGRRG